MAAEAYSKLLLHALGPFPVPWTTLHTVAIDQDGGMNTISAHQASAAPTHMQRQESKVYDKHNQSLSDTSVRDPGKWNDQSGPGKDNGSQAQEYTIDYIFKHVGIGRQTKYMVWWYGSTSGQDTLVPLENNLQHLINDYWKTFRKEKSQHCIKRQTWAEISLV